VVTSMKVATLTACERIARYAFEYCRSRGRKKVTVFHKANIMKLTDGLFIGTAKRIRDESYTDIEYEEVIIDAGCMKLVTDPTRFDVLLMENLYGDLVSDLCAGLVGGLGVVPGSNIGTDCAVFEAVHGSAPDIAGKGLANPLACIMSGVMMLNHIGERDAAKAVRSAYDKVLAAGQTLTRDLGGKASTGEFAQAIANSM
jgi:isocitrate dehydrogenase (NAD+)